MSHRRKPLSMADMGPALRRAVKKNATSLPHRLFPNPRSSKHCGSALPPLSEGGCLVIDDDRLAATAAGRQRLYAVLGALLHSWGGRSEAQPAVSAPGSWRVLLRSSRPTTWVTVAGSR